MSDVSEKIEAIFLDVLKVAGKADLMPREAIGRTPLATFDLDSLDTFEFLMQVEETFDLIIEESRIAECVCVDDLARIVVELKPGVA